MYAIGTRFLSVTFPPGGTTMSDPTTTFSPEEVLYSLIANDQKLIAKLSPEAEAKYSHTFLP